MFLDRNLMGTKICSLATPFMPINTAYIMHSTNQTVNITENRVKIELILRIYDPLFQTQEKYEKRTRLYIYILLQRVKNEGMASNQKLFLEVLVYIHRESLKENRGKKLVLNTTLRYDFHKGKKIPSHLNSDSI